MALVLKGQNDCVSCLLAVVGLGKKQGTNQYLQKDYCMVCEQVLGVKLQCGVGVLCAAPGGCYPGNM